jgi:hypothetical protein
LEKSLRYAMGIRAAKQGEIEAARRSGQSLS